MQMEDIKLEEEACSGMKAEDEREVIPTVHSIPTLLVSPASLRTDAAPPTHAKGKRNSREYKEEGKEQRNEGKGGGGGGEGGEMPHQQQHQLTRISIDTSFRKSFTESLAHTLSSSSFSFTPSFRSYTPSTHSVRSLTPSPRSPDFDPFFHPSSATTPTSAPDTPTMPSIECTLARKATEDSEKKTTKLYKHKYLLEFRDEILEEEYLRVRAVDIRQPRYFLKYNI